MSKSILIVIPHLDCGGAEKVAVNLANEFSDRGYEVEIMMMNAFGSLIMDLRQSITIKDLKASRIINSVYPIYRYLKVKKPDIIIANMWPLTIAVLVAAILSGYKNKLIFVEHTNWSTSPLLNSTLTNIVFRLTVRILYPIVDTVVTVSNGASEDLIAITGIKKDNLLTIYNPVVDPDKNNKNISPEKSIDWLYGDEKKILAVGNLKDEKDYKTLLNAFKILKSFIPAKLLIIGEGPERDMIEKLVQKLYLNEYVSLPGIINNPYPYYEKADLLVLSSKNEGFAIVLIEAMSTGTPVVSTDCRSGPSEILLNGKYGPLVQVGDYTALSKAMVDILNNPPDSSVLKNRANDFTISKSVLEYEKIF